MKMFKLFSRAAILGLLFAITVPVQADDLQDADKLFKQGLHAQAMEKVNAFLATKPKDAQARFLKGLIFAEQNNTDKAIAIFTGLTEDYPELPEPYNNLAVLYAGQGQYEKAKSALEMAIRTHPSYATAHENLGDIYAKMASQAYDRALQLDKSNTNTKTKLALIRELFSKNARTAKPVVTAQSATAPAATAPAAPPTTAPVAPAVVAAPAPAVTQAAPPKPAVTVAVLDTNPGDEALKATHDWAAAWSAKNINKYLASYTKDYKLPGLSHSAWVAQRKARVGAPKFIHVEILDAKTKVVDDSHVSVSFKQHYRASNFNSNTRKTLEWALADGQWLITEERTGK
jgi:tetratricopeptide (TPR) repeat protein